MPDIFTDLVSAVDDFEKRRYTYDPYLYFEPWDCDVPVPEVVQKALEDGVSIADDPAIKLAGPYPRKFQTGSILSTKKMVCTQAGSRSGKSICTQVVIAAMISKQPPYAFRFEEGVDTGIPRQINKVNIIRFGRRDKLTGRVIDHDTTVDLATANTKNSSEGWDCGNITGVGVFPEELYAPDGAQIWIGTVAKSIDSFWWPSFTGSGDKRFFPQEYIDTSKGNKGTNKALGIIHAIRGIDIFLKTYEQKHMKFESQTAWVLAYDEEPPDRQIYLSGAAHSIYQRFSFTPLNGRTWSEKLFFACLEHGNAKTSRGLGLKRSDFDYYYASQYDSPYVERPKLERDRRGMEFWERRARIWGQYSEFSGEPFFNRSRLLKWREIYSRRHHLARFQARAPYHEIGGSRVTGLPGILGVRVEPVYVTDENETDVWRIYETVQEGVGYLFTADAAEGGFDPEQVQDRSWGAVYRPPTPDELEELGNVPRLVAACRSTLPTIAFARSCLPVLHYYNNATLAAERGRGKDNEAFGLTLEDWPWWYMRSTRSNKTKRLRQEKGFDTNTHTRTVSLEKLRDWFDSVEDAQDPELRDERIFDEAIAAVIKERPGGKKVCDHPRTGSLDGVICLGIAAYILQESPDDYECRVQKNVRKEGGILSRLRKESEQQAHPPRIPMGAGVAQASRGAVRRPYG
jgi:phage terminase large subunit-like protein